MIRLVLENNNFSFNGKHYLQVEGTAIGSRLDMDYASILFVHLWIAFCFFRAVSLDLTGKEEHFNYVKEIVCDEIEKNQSYYEPYI
jgi:hypothetical protein